MDPIVARFSCSRVSRVKRGGKGNIAHKIFAPLITRADAGAAQVPVFDLSRRCALQTAVSIIVEGK